MRSVGFSMAHSMASRSRAVRFSTAAPVTARPAAPLPGYPYSLKLVRPPMASVHTRFLQAPSTTEIQMVVGKGVEKAQLAATVQGALCHAFILPSQCVAVDLEGESPGVRIIGLQERVRLSRVADIGMFLRTEDTVFANLCTAIGGPENLHRTPRGNSPYNHGSLYYALNGAERCVEVRFNLDVKTATGAINAGLYHRDFGTYAIGAEIWNGIDMQSLAMAIVLRLQGDMERSGKSEGHDVLASLGRTIRDTQDLQIAINPELSEFRIVAA